MGRDNEARIIQAKAAKETGLPVWIGFNAYIDSKDTIMAGGQQNTTDIAEGTPYEGSRTMKDLTLSEAVNEAIPVAPDVISIFHTRIYRLVYL